MGDVNGEGREGDLYMHGQQYRCPQTVTTGSLAIS